MPLLLCPNCNTSMQAVQRSGVELDMCPQCRGVWLDRGELEKIIDQGSRESASPSPFRAGDRPAPGRPSGGDRDHDHDRHDRHDHDDHHRHGHKKRSSIFDIFD